MTNGMHIRLNIRHVLAILSAAFLGLLTLLYNEVKTLDGKLEDLQVRIFTLALDPPPSGLNDASLQVSGVRIASEGFPVVSNQDCMDACLRAVKKKYGNVSESHERWCRRSCSQSSLNLPEDIFAAPNVRELDSGVLTTGRGWRVDCSARSMASVFG